MKKNLLGFICLIVALPCFAVTTSLQQKLNAVSLMTANDLTNNNLANLNLTNGTGVPVTVYGIYLHGVAWIEPGLNCQNGIVGHTNSTELPFMDGSTTPVSFNVGQSIPIGQNYLYNMLYTWLYYYPTAGGVAPCSLPGCSWTTDTNQYNWCFKVSAISPSSPYTHSPYQANVVPFSWAPAQDNIDYQYNYDLIPNTSDYVWLGPFTCNDKTLTCVAATPQYQSFQST